MLHSTLCLAIFILQAKLHFLFNFLLCFLIRSTFCSYVSPRIFELVIIFDYRVVGLLLGRRIEGENDEIIGKLIGRLIGAMRRFFFRVMSTGEIPNHIAFIMDGNRRYSKKMKLEEGAGHKAGFLALMSVLKYCYELGVKHVTVYAFSIDNFRRRPHEVQYVMDLMLEKIEGFLKEESIVNQYGVRVRFIGDLKLLYEPVRIAAEKAMKITEHNTNCVLLVCVAYTSSDEIPHAVLEACREKQDEYQGLNSNGHRNGEIKELVQEKPVIKVMDLEKHMYMGVAPDPDVLVRSSGETRLSNFLLWQTTSSLLYSPKALWPEMGMWEVVGAILKFQRHYSYLEKKKKQF